MVFIKIVQTKINDKGNYNDVYTLKIIPRVCTHHKKISVGIQNIPCNNFNDLRVYIIAFRT